MELLIDETDNGESAWHAGLLVWRGNLTAAVTAALIILIRIWLNMDED